MRISIFSFIFLILLLSTSQPTKALAKGYDVRPYFGIKSVVVRVKSVGTDGSFTQADVKGVKQAIEDAVAQIVTEGIEKKTQISVVTFQEIGRNLEGYENELVVEIYVKLRKLGHFDVGAFSMNHFRGRGETAVTKTFDPDIFSIPDREQGLLKKFPAAFKSYAQGRLICNVLRSNNAFCD